MLSWPLSLIPSPFADRQLCFFLPELLETGYLADMKGRTSPKRNVECLASPFDGSLEYMKPRATCRLPLYAMVKA